MTDNLDSDEIDESGPLELHIDMDKDPQDTDPKCDEDSSKQPEDVAQLVERIQICGIPVDTKMSIAPERVDKVTSGRRKIPLSFICRPGGTDRATSAGQDLFIAVVCFDIAGKDTVWVSDMIFSGSTEIKINVVDTSEISSLKGTAMLVLNPQVVDSTTLRIPSIKQCLKLGNVSGLETCQFDGCKKPVISERDGPLCYKHAAMKSMGRLSIGGGLVDTSAGDAVSTAVKKVARPPISADERRRKIQEDRRMEFQAKKKTALMLLQRKSGMSNVGQRIVLNPDEDDVLDIGIEEMIDDAKSKISRYQVLKRKREATELSDTLKEKREKENTEKNESRQVPPPKPVVVIRKSISEQITHLIKSERGGI